jgi:hypothetical protein
MDPTRFDTLTRSLGTARSRRTVLRTLSAAALGALGLRGTRLAAAAPGGNSVCAQWCHAHFSGAAAGQCTRQAAQGTGPCVPCQTSADCPTGLVCDATSHVCRGCTDQSECAPVDALGNRFCVALADGAGQSVCANFLLCTCPGTCAQCGPDQACFGTGGGPCADKNLCCPPSPAL